MRKIEQQMISAIYNRKAWQSGNTSVTHNTDASSTEDGMMVYLHGNHIAYVHCATGFVLVNKETLRRWSTPTTKSRLRALGADVSTRKGVTYLNDVAI
jgi:hypothetical protein